MGLSVVSSAFSRSISSDKFGCILFPLRRTRITPTSAILSPRSRHRARRHRLIQRLRCKRPLKAAGRGQPCHISDIKATINGQTVNGNPSRSSVHPPSNATTTTQFVFKPGFPTGTNVTPTFSYNTSTNNGKATCDCGKASCVDPSRPIPPIPVPPTPRLVIEKQLASGQSAQVVPNEAVSYVLTVSKYR